MTLTTTVLIVVVLFALAVPGVGFAAPIPPFFADEYVGFVCLTAVPPGSPAISVLVQFNFDNTAFGGISLSRADSLFSFLTGNLGLLSPIIGSNPQTTCSLTPTQTLAQFPGATALQAAQQVSGTFQQLGFSRYIIVDTFLSFAVPYSGPVDTLRSDVFLVTGNDNLSYVLSIDLTESLAP